MTDALLFCAKNNPALRGSNDVIGEPKCGIFRGQGYDNGANMHGDIIEFKPK